MQREKTFDALLGAAIKSLEELEALVIVLQGFNSSDAPRRMPITSELREIANLLDKLPLLENDLAVIKRGLRKLMSTDPDKTPRAISIKDIPAVTLEERPFEPVEERRSSTIRGIGIPLPKKE